MLTALMAIIFLGASAGFVKRHRGNAFTGTDPWRFAGDIVLTLLGAVTVAPAMLVMESFRVFLALRRDYVRESSN